LAAEIGTDRLEKGDTSDVIIGVRDEHNQRICTIKASLERVVKGLSYGKKNPAHGRVPLSETVMSINTSAHQR
jgi:hypothetical protein